MTREYTRIAWGFVCLAAGLALAGTASAQELRGRIVGEVQDHTGAVLPGATVTASGPALPQAQAYSLALYDLQGRLVKALAAGTGVGAQEVAAKPGRVSREDLDVGGDADRRPPHHQVADHRQARHPKNSQDRVEALHFARRHGWSSSGSSNGLPPRAASSTIRRLSAISGVS